MNADSLNRREWLQRTTAAGAVAALSGQAESAMSVPSGTSDRLLLLAIDDQSLPYRNNVGLYLSQPTVRPEAVLKPSPFKSGAVDDMASHFYGTVLHDGGKFRMWYYACYWGQNPDWPPRMKQQVSKPDLLPLFQGPLCYAESDDGIEWTKPNLGQVLFKGNRNNNALALPHTVVSGAIVIKDDEEPDPSRRYKMTYQFFPNFSDPVIEEYGSMPTVALAVSPDGLHWKVIGIPFRGTFVEPSSFIKHDGKYVIHYQAAGNLGGYYAEGGTPSGRTGVARLTTDFSNWPDLLAETFALAEPEDRSQRGLSGDYDQVHLGVGAAGLGNVCVGLYGLWHNAEFDTFGKISCDFGLLVSNDGVKFREPVKGYRFLRRDDSLVTAVPGHDFNTILCQANGILNVGDETRIYHGRWRNANGKSEEDDLKYYSGEVALATLPRDRWGAFGLDPDAQSGSITSALIEVPASGGKILLNADGTRAMRVELLDENFQPLAEFSGANAGVMEVEGGLDCPVHWPKDIGLLRGKRVRLRIELTRVANSQPRLYAVGVRG